MDDMSAPKKKPSNDKGANMIQAIHADSLLGVSKYYKEALQSTKYSLHDLHDYLVAAKDGAKKLLPKEKQRYVIYLRKSTDDEAKQVRSIDDQRKECLKLANDLGVTVRKEDIFEEKHSAKESGKRTTFNTLLLGFKSGKYHGLISWSPDRLSRNMKEAGEIIEMIDHEEIQSLHFVTYHFDNSPNGKMMLGILFATSKQYSDKLSVDVMRGNRGNLSEGKYNGSAKKGYYLDDMGRYMPDLPNLRIVRQAIDKRLYERATYEEVADFMNKQGLTQRRGEDDTPELIKMTKQKAARVFSDPLYCGIYEHGGLVNLMDIYNFTPLMTVDEYIQLNTKLSRDFNTNTVVRTNSNKRLEFGLMNGMVICDFCDKTMKFQHQQIKRGKNKDRWVVSFYCNNTQCLRHDKEEQALRGIKLSKSIRAKYVLAGIEWQLRHLTKKSAEAYRIYKDDILQNIASEKAIASRTLNDSKQTKRQHQEKLDKYLELHLNAPEDYKRYHNGKIEEFRGLVELDEQTIASNETKIKRLKVRIPTEDDFFELPQSKLLDMLNTDDIVTLDTLCREFVVNLRAGDNSTPVIKLKQPYNYMTVLTEKSLGSGGRI